MKLCLFSSLILFPLCLDWVMSIVSSSSLVLYLLLSSNILVMALSFHLVLLYIFSSLLRLSISLMKRLNFSFVPSMF